MMIDGGGFVCCVLSNRFRLNQWFAVAASFTQNGLSAPKMVYLPPKMVYLPDKPLLEKKLTEILFHNIFC